MTIIVGVVARNGVFLAADSLSSSSSTPGHRETIEKLRVLDGPVLAATGGYGSAVIGDWHGWMNAIQRAHGDVSYTTDFVSEWFNEVLPHYLAGGDAIARGLGVASTGSYSVSAGLNTAGEFSLKVNNHVSGKTEDIPYGSSLVMGTDTDALRALASPIHDRFIRPGRVSLDVWASEIIAAGATAYPDSIAFPAKMGVITGRGVGAVTDVTGVITTGDPGLSLTF